MLDPQAPARLANDIGRRFGVVCSYKWSAAKGAFLYHFYRRGIFVGSTADASRVINKMEKLTCSK